MGNINEKAKIIPFLWMNKESKNDLIKELEYIKNLGITSVMLESRVYENFCQQEWFDEMDVVMDFARENNMTVWILDDKSYPSGYANGAFEKLYPEHSARFIISKKTDVVGPRKNAKVIVKLSECGNERLIGAFLCKRKGIDNYSMIIDVTKNVHGNFLYLDIPEGEYSVIQLIETPRFAERKFYIDMLSSKSVDKFIEAVYEKHYERYKDDFGKTFMGFFSDEPRFANGRYSASSYYKYKIRYIIGEFGTAYPWSKDVGSSFNKTSDILALWYDIGAETSRIRCEYMELITDIMSRNFPKKLSDWCKERNVCYAGHIIEDNGCHTSTGCSLGHYFKSQRGASMASVDIVLHQIKPFDNSLPHYGPIAGGYGYPEFFNYTLLKLASSCARLDREKQGRALCEIFGAYGWGESTNDMLYLLNLCISEGINRFIPHAFTHVFGLEECPPHFYAGLNTTMSDHMVKLFGYMDNMAEKFSGGEALCEYAVLYHAQTEWTGKKYSPIDGIMKTLSDYQIGVDIVDFEYLFDVENLLDGFIICGRKYKKLICPYFEELPIKYKKVLDSMGDNVVLIGEDNVIPSDILNQEGGSHREGLHILPYVKDKIKYTFAFNGGLSEYVVENINGYKYAVDYVLGCAIEIDKEVVIKKGQAVVLQDQTDGLPIMPRGNNYLEVESFDVSIKALNEEIFSFYKKDVDVNFDINSFENIPNFSGSIKYSFAFDKKDYDYIEIDYDADGMVLVVDENKISSIGGKLIYSLSKKDLEKGEFEIILLNSFAYRFMDKYSEFNYIAPTKINRVAFYKKV